MVEVGPDGPEIRHAPRDDSGFASSATEYKAPPDHTLKPPPQLNHVSDSRQDYWGLPTRSGRNRPHSKRPQHWKSLRPCPPP